MIPIPGEPCRSEDDSLAPSRVQDDFRLELRFTPPEQQEEDALRDFVEWLRQIEIADGMESFATLDEFLVAIRAAVQFVGSPPQSPPDFMFGSPPAGLRIPAAAACAYWRAALRIWVTELRPLWLGKGQTCRTPPDEECLLLAELKVPLAQVTLSGEWRVDDSRQVGIHEERRPYLLPLRLLQEWILCGRLAGESSGGGGGGLSPVPGSAVVAETTFGQPANVGISPDYSRADHTHGTPSLPAIPAPADTVVAETTFGRVANHGTAATYSRADHTHGTPPLPAIPALPAPANTVVAETTAGRAAAAGVSTDYSRADHTHGTPPLPAIPAPPAPANSVVAETVFGHAASAGVSLQYSRADHTHGTPPAPQVAGNFVEHPNAAGSFAIVAAGVVRRQAPSRSPVYNKLEVIGVNDGEVFVRFDQYKPPKEADEFQYVIKVLPVFRRQLETPIIVNFARYEPDAFVLHVTSIRGEVIKADQLAQVELMIEVSQYPFAQ
jgi:hypothetical protein